MLRLQKKNQAFITGSTQVHKPIKNGIGFIKNSHFLLTLLLKV